MIHFNMAKINVEQFAILASTLPSGTDISLSTELSFMYSLDSKRVACMLGITFSSPEEKIILLKIRCEFSIHPDDWATFINGNRLIIPKQLLDFFAMHTIGTARGILFCKTEGTPFNSMMIPPINVSSMITNGIDEQISSEQ